MSKKTLVYTLALLVVTGAVGAISASAHGWGFGFGPGEPLFTQEEVEAKIAEKVADGTISQEQADLRLERMASAEARHADMQAMHDENIAELAEFLGISVDELDAEIKSGMRISQIAEAQGISEEEMLEFHKQVMLDHQQERLNQLVDEGKLTQAEADEKLEQLRNGEWLGPGPPGKHSPGGMHRGSWGEREPGGMGFGL